MRERDGLADEYVAILAAESLLDHPPHVVGVVGGLGEGVLHSLFLALDQAKPVAVAALEAAALHLHTQDRFVGFHEDEVDLTVLRALSVIAVDPADRVK